MPSRLVISETVYHQNHDADPTSADSCFSRTLASDEQPYSRRVVIGEAWQPLDCGWVEQASMLVLANQEGRFVQVIPTQAERDTMAAKIVEVGYGDMAAWLVRPGESFRAEPADLKAIRVRCRSGSAKCQLTVFPA